MLLGFISRIWNLFDKYVVRFDIAVNNALFVEINKSINHLKNNKEKCGYSVCAYRIIFFFFFFFLQDHVNDRQFNKSLKFKENIMQWLELP